jgi:hypothetical protein
MLIVGFGVSVCKHKRTEFSVGTGVFHEPTANKNEQSGNIVSIVINTVVLDMERYWATTVRRFEAAYIV